MSSESLLDGDPVPGGVFIAGGRDRYPDDVVVREGSGPYVVDGSGQRYVDYVMGGGPMLVGHAHPHVVQAIQEQAERGTAFYLSSEPAFEFAERIVEAVPCAEQVHFTSTGSEATYFALRLARAHTGREKVLKFAGAYHGFHDFVMTSSTFADDEELLATEPPAGTRDSAGLVEGAVEETLVAQYNDVECTREVVEDHAEDLAAIIVEPIQRVVEPVDGFLEELRSLCDEHGIVLIFDEVVTGFRVAYGGAQEYYGIEPDLAAYGKGLGGGTPVGAIAGPREILSVSDPTVPKSEGGAPVFGTLNGNPLCAVAGNATLDVLSRPGTYRALHDYGDRFRTMIDEVIADSPLSGTALGVGPVVSYALTDAGEVTRWETLVGADKETQRRIDAAMVDHGVTQVLGSKRYVSTEHGDEELELTEEAFKRAVEDVARSR